MYRQTTVSDQQKLSTLQLCKHMAYQIDQAFLT